MGAISVSVSRVYPPLAWGAANVFELPDPFAADLPPTYAAHGGAQHFLKIFYADGSAPEFALIAQVRVRVRVRTLTLTLTLALALTLTLTRYRVHSARTPAR